MLVILCKVKYSVLCSTKFCTWESTIYGMTQPWLGRVACVWFLCYLCWGCYVVCCLLVGDIRIQVAVVAYIRCCTCMSGQGYVNNLAFTTPPEVSGLKTYTIIILPFAYPIAFKRYTKKLPISIFTLILAQSDDYTTYAVGTF